MKRKKKILTEKNVVEVKTIKVRNVKATAKNIKAGLVIPVGSLP